MYEHPEPAIFNLVQQKSGNRLEVRIDSGTLHFTLEERPQPRIGWRNWHTGSDGLPTLSFTHEGPAKADSKRKPLEIRNKKQVVFYAKTLIAAIQETLDYDPKRHHNRPPPALRIENPEYLEELRQLVGELRKLNELLEAPMQRRSPDTAAINLAKHFDRFLHKYSGALGTGAACLTIGVVAALLGELGLGGNMIGNILKHFK
jgi:hypothetical protein